MIALHNLTGVYEMQDFYLPYPHIFLEEREVTGLRGYMDEETEERMREKLSKISEDTFLRFLDSGNYHHLSYIYTGFIKTDFNLVVFDNHTDMQSSAFGPILSCGSWILEAITKNPFLKKVVLIGVKESYRLACSVRNEDKVIFLDSVRDVEQEIFSLPVYLSIDKDVLSSEDFLCDWDQGEMRFDTLIRELAFVRNTCRLIGVDVCGAPPVTEVGAAFTDNLMNKRILEVFY